MFESKQVTRYDKGRINLHTLDEYYSKVYGNDSYVFPYYVHDRLKMEHGLRWNFLFTK